MAMILRDMMYEGMELRGYDYDGSQEAMIPEQTVPINQ